MFLMFIQLSLFTLFSFCDATDYGEIKMNILNILTYETLFYVNICMQSYKLLKMVQFFSAHPVDPRYV